ncbi:MAG TPA: phosphoribosyltransferase family protein [Patescibacteria group bacterium]|nr:phosphoribosyltransferase family protein [Patescibacteria group bacterium]
MNKSTNQVLSLLKKADGIFQGHFVYTSGKHAPRYLNKMAIFAHPLLASKLGKLFADKYKSKKVDVVVAPALGGIVLAQWVAYHLSKAKKREIIAVYTEKDKGTSSSGAESNQIFTRGYDKYVKDKKVLIVEDIVTTGISVIKVVRAVKKAGGTVIGVCSMANINAKPASITDKLIGAKYSYLAELPVVMYDEAKCELCLNKIPINTNLGHGKKFIEERLEIKD